jgi:histidinol-phosphate aminotransferase
MPATPVITGSPRLRPIVREIPAYAPGQLPRGRGQACKLSSNESPYDPLPSVREAVAAAAGHINRYPDIAATALTGALAEHLSVPASHVALGCGSAGVIQQLLAATSGPGTQVLYGWRSFEAYPLMVQLAGATEVTVPLRADTHDLPAMTDAVSPRTSLIIVCNPNNPTGTVVHTGEFRAFLDRVPGDCLVVLDEAYREFVRDPAVPNGLDLYRDHPNLAVLRTFSKAYGLAGLRIGFLIAQPPVAEAVRKTMVPFAVNTIAQAAAIASLAAEAELLKRVDAVALERTRVRGELLAWGFPVPATEANFLWLRLGPATTDFAAACERAGISIRPFPGEGARVTIGDRSANDSFLAVARQFQRDAAHATPAGHRQDGTEAA